MRYIDADKLQKRFIAFMAGGFIGALIMGLLAAGHDE